MYNITLLSSFHVKCGKCNPDELYKIISGLQPEIIFEELPFNIFETIHSPGYKPETVEAIAVKRYLQKYPIKHFPVDTYPINEADLLSDAQIIWDSSSEYRDLYNLQLLKIREDGYNFLNSNECSEILRRISRIEETFLTETNNLQLLSEYENERVLHDKRENEMLRNVYEYSKQYPFDKAMFICGAVHRQPFVEKIAEYGIKENLKLIWAFYNGN